MSALAARWSARSFPSQPWLQFLVRFDSHNIVPALLAGRPHHPVQDVSTELALGHRFDDVRREPAGDEGLQFELQNLALQLLGTLLGLAPELLDLALHAGDLFFFLGNLHPEAIFGFGLGLNANGVQPFLNSLFNRQRHFALFIIKRSLLLQEFRLLLLGLGKLLIPRR
jgi:hypothetical protein